MALDDRQGRGRNGSQGRAGAAGSIRGIKLLGFEVDGALLLPINVVKVGRRLKGAKHRGMPRQQRRRRKDIKSAGFERQLRACPLMSLDHHGRELSDPLIGRTPERELGGVDNEQVGRARMCHELSGGERRSGRLPSASLGAPGARRWRSLPGGFVRNSRPTARRGRRSCSGGCKPCSLPVPGPA